MTLTKELIDKAADDFEKYLKKKYPPKKEEEKPIRSRFDHMTPEQLRFWEDEHQ